MLVHQRVYLTVHPISTNMAPPKTEDHRIIGSSVLVSLWDGLLVDPTPKKIAGLLVMFPSIEPLVG